MTRYEEIEARLADISVEVPEADADKMTVLEEEVRSLKEEKIALENEEKELEERRKAVAEETIPTVTVEKFEEKKMERTFAVDSAEYREAWLKNLMGRQLDAEERTAVSGEAAVIPTTTLNKIVVRLEENALLSKVDLMQIPGYIRIPVYSTNNDANWTTTASDSADALTYIDLKPYQLIKTVEIQADMDKMSIGAFESSLVNILANKIEAALQKAIIVGSGSANSQPTGLATTKSTDDGTFTKAGITKADLLNIMGALPADFQQNACWIMPNKLFYEIMAIASINDFAGVAAGIGNHIAGKPVVLDDNCVISSTDTIFYGDPKHYRMNLGEGVKVDRDESVGFRSNSAVYRGVCQADGQLDLAAAFVRYSRHT